MIKRTMTATGFVMGLALSGCGGPTTPPPEPWTQGEAPKKLEVEQVHKRLALDFAPGSTRLSPAMRIQLNEFLDQSEVRPHEHLVIEAADEPWAAARIGSLVKELDERNLAARTVRPEADMAPNRLVLRIDRYMVSLPDCPDWHLPPADDHDNTPHSNLGCANVTNFGLMVDDPHDLIAGRKMGPAEGDPALNAIARYRAEKVPMPPWDSSAMIPDPTAQSSTAGAAAGGAPAGGGGSPSQ